MTEEEWQGIVQELSEQNASISIERAVARTQVKTCLKLIEELKKQNKELMEQLDQSSSTIQTATKE